MYTLMITMVLGVIVALIISIKESSGWWDVFDYIGNTLIIVLHTVLGGIAGLSFGIVIATPFAMNTRLEQRQILIENLQDGSSVHGSFFLGCVQIDGKMVYTYYTKQGDLYELNQMDAIKVKIRYSDSRPRIVFNKRVAKWEGVNLWAIDWNHGELTDYVIEVPRGTIKSNYTLDAQ